MDKVAVRKAVGVQYPVTGAPILVTGGGGRGRGAVGVTRGQRALGALGMLAGAAGALTGQHRSLGGLVQSAISGGAQGSALGRGVGRALTTRTGQARADLREQRRLDSAAERAAELEQPYQEGRNLGSLAMLEGDGSSMARRFAAGAMNPGAYNRRRAFERQEALRRANEANVGVRQQAQQNVEDAAQMRREGARFRQARAAARGDEFGAEDARYAQVARNFGNMVGGMSIDDLEHRTAAAMAARGSGNVGVADFTPTNARGEEVDAQLPQLPPPAGSVASNNETADRAGQGVTDRDGFNMVTENEPGDVAVKPSRPMEEEGGSEQGISDLQTRAFSGMSQSEQRRKEEEEFRAAQAQQNPQRRLVGVN